MLFRSALRDRITSMMPALAISARLTGAVSLEAIEAATGPAAPDKQRPSNEAKPKADYNQYEGRFASIERGAFLLLGLTFESIEVREDD